MPPSEQEYQDQFAKLFPELCKTYIKPDGTIVEPFPKTVTYQVTDDCNMACTYCYQHNKHHHIMNWDMAKKFTDWLLDDKNEYVNQYNSPAIIIEFIGGEPFLAIDLIDQICTYFMTEAIKKRHPWALFHCFSICSNGLLYFDPKVQTFLQKHPFDLAFSISIDGNKELHDMCRKDLNGHGTYDIAIQGVKHYQKHSSHHSIGSKMTLSPDNITFTYQAVKNLLENDYRIIHLNCVYEEGWKDKHGIVLYEELKLVSDYLIETELYKTCFISLFNSSFYHPMDPIDNKNWCGGVNDSMLAMDYKGDLYPCIRYMESSLGNNQPPIIIGNVNHGTYITKDEQNWRQELLNVTRRNQSTDECFNCPIAMGCAWCSAYNYEKFGTIRKRATFICPMHKATSLANVYYWNLVFIKENDPRRFKMWLSDKEAKNFISDKEIEMLHMLENFPHIETKEMQQLLKDV